MPFSFSGGVSASNANTFTALQTFNGGLIIPNNQIFTASYFAYINDNVTVIPILSINDDNTINTDVTNTSNFFACGGSADSRHPSNMGCWVHNNGGYAMESYDFVRDMTVMNTSQDTNDNLLIGCIVDFHKVGSIVFNVSANYLGTGPNNAYYFQVNHSNVAAIISNTAGQGRLQTQAGGCNFVLPASVGGVLFDHYTDVSTTDTNGTEDTLYTDSILANTLVNNGDKLIAKYYGTFVSSATATRRLKVYFAGSNIFDSTALVSSSASDWAIDVTIIQVSSTSVRTMVVVTAPGLASFTAPLAYNVLTGLTLTGNNTLYISGIATGTGAASGDIVAKMATIDWKPAAIPLTVPLSLLPVAWYKADVGTYVSSGGAVANTDGTAVGYWQDQGLFGRNLVQTTSADKPTYQSNSGAGVQNGLPVIRFDGTDDFLVSTFTLNQPASFYIVASTPSNAGGGQANIMDGSSANSTVLYSFFGGNMNMYAGSFFISGVPSGLTVSPETFYTFKAVFNGTSSIMSFNNGTGGTNNPANATSSTNHNPGTNNPGGLSVGGGNNNPAVIDIGEIIVFNRVLSGADETALFSYLRTRWATW